MNLTTHEIERRLGALFDDPDLAAIHARMSPFNIFEAIGATRGELKHSNFLAYLLSPNRPHGLGVRPLVAFLRSVLEGMEPEKRPILPLDLIVADLDGALVFRERDNIDILIELKSLNLVVVIENKVGSKAGDGQLKRYFDVVSTNYPNYRKILVFLTPDSATPDHDEYVAFDYSGIVSTFDSLINLHSGSMPPETKLVIEHYLDMVRRHVVQDERLRALAIALYERHREALDFIFDCRPEPDTVLATAVQCVKQCEGLIVDSQGKRYIKFVPNTWDEEFRVIKGDSAQKPGTGCDVFFEIKTYEGSGRLNLALIIGPGSHAVRKGVYTSAAAMPDVFKVRSMGAKWATIFSRDLIRDAQAKKLSFEDLQAKAQNEWEDFVVKQLPQLTEAMLKIDKSLARSSTG